MLQQHIYDKKFNIFSNYYYSSALEDEIGFFNHENSRQFKFMLGCQKKHQTALYQLMYIQHHNPVLLWIHEARK